MLILALLGVGGAVALLIVQIIWIYKAVLSAAVFFIYPYCVSFYGYHNESHFHQYFPNET